MKTKRKFFPANTADIPALESWLEDMALEGLFPLSFNGYYAKFRQGEPQKMTYRIEVPKYVQAEPPKTMRETYEDFGWQFVCHMWQKYYLFPVQRNAPLSRIPTHWFKENSWKKRGRILNRLFLLALASLSSFCCFFPL